LAPLAPTPREGATVDEPALDAPPPGAELARVERYFRAFLPALRGQLLIEELHALDTAFAIDVSDRAGPPWLLAVEAGRLVHVGTCGPPPRCAFRLDAATLLEVAAGRTRPAEAFFARRIEVEGDVEEGLRLSTVLEPFFRRFPYRG
jgi:predicted lipid carrier protein YhbT